MPTFLLTLTIFLKRVSADIWHLNIRVFQTMEIHNQIVSGE